MHLYPYDAVRGTCQDTGKVTDALTSALGNLESHGAIDYYEILRFRTEDYTSPDYIDGESGTSTEEEFRNYLQSNNGTGEDLYTRVGVHHLLHTGQNACDEDSENYAPSGANAEANGDGNSAFNEPLISWSPACDSNDSLTRAAAVQEPLHQCITSDHDDPYVGGSTGDQHSLGKVNSSYDATPMITYHWDDSGVTGAGDCLSDVDPGAASGHTVYPTSCSRYAVRDTADAHVDSNLKNC